MAYVFDSIDSALNGQPAGADKADIFGADASQAGGQPGQVAQGAVKTSTEGDLNGMQGAGSSSSAPAGGQPKESAFQNAGAALSKNTAQFSGMPSQFKGQVDKINSDLQSEADSYVQKQAAKGSSGNLDQATLAKAADGDADAGAKVTGRLSQAAPSVDPYQSSVDTKVKDLDALNSSDGLSSLLSRNAGSNYSAGMAGLDSMLLGQNKDFIKERQGLNDTQNQLRAKASATDDVTKKAQEAAASGFNSGTGLIKDYLGERERAIQSAAQKRMADYNGHLKSLSPDDFIKQQRDAAVASLRDSAADQPFAGQIVSAANALAYNKQNDPLANLRQYYSTAAPAADLGQFYTADDASKFNRIEGLLGGNQAIAAGGPLGPEQTFNGDAYRQALQAKAQEFQQHVLDLEKQRASSKIQAADKAKLAALDAAKAKAAKSPVLGQAAISGPEAGFDPTPTGFIFTQPPDPYVQDNKKYAPARLGTAAF